MFMLRNLQAPTRAAPGLKSNGAKHSCESSLIRNPLATLSGALGASIDGR